MNIKVTSSNQKGGITAGVVKNEIIGTSSSYNKRQSLLASIISKLLIFAGSWK